MPDEARKMLVVGKISGIYGVKGWVRVYSWTHPKENILTYGRWQVGAEGAQAEMLLKDGKAHGKGVVAKLDGCNTREQAELLMGREISIFLDELEELGEGEFYWRDLIGLKVSNLQQEELGVVKSLMETGANNVLVVKGEQEYLVPWVKGQFVHKVDLASGTIVVDWDKDF